MIGRNDRIRELYEAALKRPIGERTAFVSAHSHGDTDLELRVKALLTGQQDTQLPGYEGADGTTPLLATGTAIGHYRIDGPLGAGGMGVVYHATDSKLNRPAAVKVLPENLADPEARRRFQREAQMVSSLNHPHIVTVYDAGEHRGRQYLITEYVDGGTLRQWAAKPRGWRSIVELLVGVADAVAVAHEAGILHRDLKPENILLAKNGYAKLADFGLAKLLETDPLADDAFAGAQPDAHSSLIGTAAYMSPEQAQGLPLDGRSDVYSFGLVLHELLSGVRPDAARALEQRHGGTPAGPKPLGDGVPAELRALVAKALEHDPADRYQTMRELVVDLRRVTRRSDVQDAAPSRASSRTALIAASVTLVAVVAAILFYTFGLRAPPGNAVAVLPFEIVGGSADDAYLSEGVSGALRGRLSEVPGLRVQARASSTIAGELGEEPRAIAARLGVAVLIDGSLRRRGDLLSVDVEALDAEGNLLRSWTRETSDRGLIALEAELAADVVAFFAPEAPPAAVAVTTPTQESAHDLVLRAMEIERPVRDDLTVDTAKLDEAIDLYRQAVAADPNSIAAHSRLASALVYQGRIDEAAGPLLRARQLREQNVPTTAFELSDFYYTTALYLLAIRSSGTPDAYEFALNLNPNNAEAHAGFAQWLMVHNRTAEARVHFEQALDLDKELLSRYVDYAELLTILEDMDAARAIAARILERFDDPRGYRAVARVFENIGDLDVAIAWGLKAYRDDPGHIDSPDQLAEHYARIGDLEKSRAFESQPLAGTRWLSRDYAELRDLTEDLSLSDPFDLRIRYFLAFAHNALGAHELAAWALTPALPLEPAADYMTGPLDQTITTYIDALLSIPGREAEGLALAEKKAKVVTATERRTDHAWWEATFRACTLMQVGRKAEALGAIDELKLSKGLPWEPLLRDSPCFRGLADEPRYRDVLTHIGDRQTQLRKKLPATLIEHGVADVQPLPRTARTD